MNVLVIGSGGREHALVWKLSSSRRLERLYCAPGNPGIAKLAECLPVAAGDLRSLLAVALDNRIDLVVVGPEQPLAAGIADLFVSKGLKVFGPTRGAARLEWSKAFAKEFMRRRGIPTAGFQTFTRARRDDALQYLRTLTGRVVLKADGLAAGKGVVICENPSAAEAVLEEMLTGRAFGASGETVVIEEFLQGVEASVFAVTDGNDAVVLAPAQDHKRALDGDRGKNTGGMGAYAPTPVVTPDVLQRVRREIIVPTLEGMRDLGTPFTGCLYVGLMLTRQGPRVVEYNCRFGDPETQVVLPLYRDDLLDLLEASSTGTLQTFTAAEDSPPSGAAVCVVLASEGYPDEYPKGRPIRGLGDAASVPGVLVFHAGVEERNGVPVTAGGRVLGVTAVDGGGDIGRAVARAYEAAGKIVFDGVHYRRDIAARALASPSATREAP